MTSFAGIFALTLTLFCVFSSVSHAQDEPAPEPPRIQFTDALRSQNSSLLAGSSMKIISEAEGLFVVDTRGKKLPAGSQLLFVRMRKGDLDILARGKVEASQGTTSLVQLLEGSIRKAPLRGDIAISIGEPWTPKPETEKDPAPNFIYAEEPAPTGDPGYIELGSGTASGALNSQTTNQANQYKAGTFDFGMKRGLIFFEFAWRIGLEFESISGKYPTSTYFREDGPSSESWDNFSLHVRSRAILNKMFRPSLKLSRFNHTFTTINRDEYLITSTYSGIGLGGRLAVELAPHLYTSTSFIGVRLQELWGEASYFPVVDALDVLVMRGSSSQGSSANEYRLGATAIVYVKWIPFVKRYYVSFTTGVRAYNLKFQGPTVGEIVDNQPGPYTIPENGEYKETRSFTMITFGVRFDDFIGQFLKPR